MLACHAGGPGSIPGRCNIFLTLVSVAKCLNGKTDILALWELEMGSASKDKFVDDMGLCKDNQCNTRLPLYYVTI
jgi:hypothetical protein